jgi:uncharacterized protein YndB with AHSA1/START domain
MPPITYSVEIARPPRDVFAYLSDVSRFPEWQEKVISADVEGGSMKQGARLTMTRMVGRRRRTFVNELTDYTPPRSQAFRGISGPIRPAGKVIVDPLDDGGRSRVTFELEFEGRGFGKLLVPLIRRQAAQEVPAAHEKLKERLERGTAFAPRAGTGDPG